MRLFKSIRWRLQLWYGLILVAVLAGFGTTANQLERGRVFRRVDEELQRRAAAVANALRPPPLRGQIPPERGQGEANRERPPLQERRLPNQRRLERPLGEGSFDRLPTSDEIRTRLQRTGLFDESNTNSFYYVVWSRDGNELVRSTNAPASSWPETARLSDAPTARDNAPPRGVPRLFPPERRPPLTRGQYREIVQAPRIPGEVVRVGRSIAPELNELRNTAWKLTGIGGAILLFGLAGGWWITSRAMRPIQNISGTATKISAGDLSQRINVADTESELGQLAGTLNSTFSRLDAAFGQQRQFTADAAHELRTPLAVILSETQATLTRERSAEEYRQAVEVCQRITQRMRRLIESLMELARFDAGQEKLKRMKFDLSATVRDCVELVQPLADERNVRIYCDVPSLDCVGDAERIAQFVTNLLTNAVQYNKPNGEVTLSARREGSLAVLAVADTGLGIAPEDVQHVFERFYRVDKSRSHGHTGLGLAICKAIVEGHGGTIAVASQPNQGSTFTVRLPIGDMDSEISQG